MPTGTQVKRPDNVKVTYRRMEFDFEQGFPRYWHDGSPAITLFWNALSQSFPAGEKFFIDSVRALQNEITDPELRREIDHFVAQEAHHTAQHQKFNKMVSAQGFDMERIEARYSGLLDFARKRYADDPHAMLGITMALEHFTAGFAVQYLNNPHVTKGADDKVAALWAWHAAEEAEHKSTAFDVFEALGGTYPARIKHLAPAWGLLLALTLWNTYDLLKQDHKLGDGRDIRKALSYLLGGQGLIRGMLPSLGDYYKLSFHPWRRNDAALISGWASKYGHHIRQLGFKKDALRNGAATSASA